MFDGIILFLSILIFLVEIGLFYTKKLGIAEFIALFLLLIGGLFMVLMGKTPIGYTGAVLFALGALVKVLDIIQKSKMESKKRPNLEH